MALVALVLVVYGVGLGVRAYILHLAEERLQAAIAETDLLDPGWRWEERLAARETIPEDENSAPHVLAAAALLPKDWPHTPARPPEVTPGQGPLSSSRLPSEQHLPQRLARIDPNRQLNAQFVVELQGELRALDSALEKAGLVIRLSRGRYPIVWDQNYLLTSLSHVQEARRLGDLFRLQAALLAQEGRLDDALAFTRGVLNAGRSVGDEPTQISLLVRIAIGDLAIRTLERVMARGETSSQKLADMQRSVGDEASAVQPLIVKAVRAERAGLFETWNLLSEGAISFEDFMVIRKPGPRAWYSRLWEWVYAPPLARLNQAEYLRFMNRVVAIAQLPYAEQAKEYDQLKEDIREQRTSAPQLSLGHFLIPVLPKVTAAHQRYQALLTCAGAALAAERYRLEHGQWPESPDQLVPKFLEQVPEDPFGAGALHYRRSADSIIIYSVGPDGKDDNGTLDRDNQAKPGTDVGFQLWDLPHRRQPPAEPAPSGPTPLRPDPLPQLPEK